MTIKNRLRLQAVRKGCVFGSKTPGTAIQFQDSAILGQDFMHIRLDIHFIPPKGSEWLQTGNLGKAGDQAHVHQNIGIAVFFGVELCHRGYLLFMAGMNGSDVADAAIHLDDTAAFDHHFGEVISQGILHRHSQIPPFIRFGIPNVNFL